MTEFHLVCPIPNSVSGSITLAHGGGGLLMHDLISKVFAQEFSNPILNVRHDSAVFNLSGKLAFTTDSYVVKPLFFPGGDIGKLAICGTVNDLAMSGARPVYLSAGFIIEEGFPMESLVKIVRSMGETCRSLGIQIVTGDTKVVDKGKGDGLFINTSGVGVIEHDLTILPTSINPGDVILVNGDLARHGISIISTRENLTFETQIESDCTPLWDPIQKLIENKIEIHCLRDLTRGGLATTLNEISQSSGFEISINSKDILVNEEVKGACEILGFDPLYVANEGRFIAFLPEAQAEKALSLLKTFSEFENARIIGKVLNKNSGRVILHHPFGSSRILDMLTGDQLPRIC